MLRCSVQWPLMKGTLIEVCIGGIEVPAPLRGTNESRRCLV